ncbi:MAG: hypothetical protein G01um101418_230 [Parcubacteria group bacterium Gr01-1014_18]|nr:MAG: hypothetical protein Greene041636_198 [Parcubacteria group bacterium Greene0416_36]TSC81390.1 MAG: hypothetical protein G01um101418_230 [Parcubacteria group bacterium Gr01-1014_18]TSC99424.1 MAG: hypothetical protein Greene101420_91 [Parcubacteria group bacterium Greene1014_20]TSD07657.1 MAG: hypothetical protein Greene07142_114 [Parcubacteria group bacterium Greene0714_2]
MYDLIPFLVIGGAVAGIIFILSRRWNDIVSFSPKDEESSGDKAIKKQLVERRMDRIIKEKKERIGKNLRPVVSKISGMLGSWHNSIQDLYHRENARKGFSETSVPARGIDRGWAHVEEGRLAEAEGEFIAVLSKEPKNISAYEGLSRVYLGQRDLEKAKETLIYILKVLALSSGDPNRTQTDIDVAKYHFLLGDIFFEERDWTLAAKHFEKAYFYDSKNPKYIDRMIEMGIIGLDITKARDYLLKLKLANPENQKIRELEERIDNIRK